MPTPKLWSKLEDAGDVTSPQLGTGGAEVGSPTYPAAKFGNGMYSDANEGCTFPTAANSINGAKGTIEFWLRPQFDSPGSGTYKNIIYCIGTAQIRIHWQVDGGGRFFASFSNGSKFVEVTGISFSAGDLLHFAVTWDEEGLDIGGGKTIAVYVDNVEEGSITTTWTAGAVAANMQVGHAYSTYFSDMIIDNIKTYDVCKTDFSDRGYEGVEETFGKTIKGLSTNDSGANYIRGSLYQSGSAGQIDSITMWIKESGATRAHVKCAIYETSGLDLVAGTEDKYMDSSIDDWVTFNFASKPSVLAATNYWLLFWCDETISFYWDTGTSRYRSGITYDGWPDPLTGSSAYTRDISIYATYYQAPPPSGVKTLVQAALISAAPLIAIPTLGQIIKVAGG